MIRYLLLLVVCNSAFAQATAEWKPHDAAYQQQMVASGYEPRLDSQNKPYWIQCTDYGGGVRVVQGPPGIQGKQGIQGIQGIPGTVDYVKLTAQLGPVVDGAVDKLYDKLLAALILKLEALVKDIKTPSAQEIADLVAAKLKADNVFLASIAALVVVPAPPTPPAPEPPKQTKHFVLVVDQRVSYWPSLKEKYEKAQEKLSNFKLAPPPTNTSEPMPQLVYYRGSNNPIRRHIGVYNVSEALGMISRGTYKFE